MKSKPDWLKIKLPGDKYNLTKKIINTHRLNTVCSEAKCPNIAECWSNLTATFMILGNVCTRSCKFCNVKTAAFGEIVDDSEPDRIADVVREMGLKYIVLTSVDRDDLADMGAKHFANCIRKVSATGACVEVLTPDFRGTAEHIDIVCEAKPYVFGHNIETVKRLQKYARDLRASYNTSLSVLKHVADNYSDIIVKSGLMVGIGESKDEVIETMSDLYEAGVRAITIGQYLRPSKKNIPVKRYVTPSEFDEYRNIAYDIGFDFVASSPFVRSSYRAWELKKLI